MSLIQDPDKFLELTKDKYILWIESASRDIHVLSKLTESQFLDMNVISKIKLCYGKVKGLGGEGYIGRLIEFYPGKYLSGWIPTIHNGLYYDFSKLPNRNNFFIIIEKRSYQMIKNFDVIADVFRINNILKDISKVLNSGKVKLNKNGLLEVIYE